MSKNVKIRKGVDIKLKGTPEKVISDVPNPETFAIKPPDFHGLVPKMEVKEGDEVKAGTVVFHDKYNEHVKFTSPVSGEVAAIVRGAKRRIMEVHILADQEMRYEELSTSSGNREEVKESLLNSGLWPLIKQRPYDIVADSVDVPKAIHISAFDSAPLAPDFDFIAHGNAEVFQAGLDAIAMLTDGRVHLNVNAAQGSSRVFTESKNCQVNKFSGPHPAGNVGVQIHHIDPINKGDKVWVLSPMAVLTIGRFFQDGKLDLERIVAVCGSQVRKPKYYRVIAGTSVKNMLEDAGIEGDNNRFITGNPLTGTKIEAEGYLGFYDSQVTVIPEGDNYEFFGWLAPGFDKFSLSRTFFSWLTPGKEYTLDANLHGEERAFVVTGQYESVFPMDIYPQHLVKAIITDDIEKMENLGIYEVAPEDFALCEYACTSKINVQEIVRGGLDLVKEECG